MLRIRGLIGDGFEFIDDGSDESDSLLPFVQAASVQSRIALGPESGRPIQSLRDHAAAAASTHAPVAAPDSLCHESNGFSLHAKTRVEAQDRERLEQLCRYVARPALCQARFSVRGDGKVLWELRKPWRDGTRAFVFDPLTKRRLGLRGWSRSFRTRVSTS